MSDTTNTGTAASDGAFARIGGELDNLFRNLAPCEEACDHFRNARIEVLKGLRAFIDHRIERLSADQKGTSVEVE